MTGYALIAVFDVDFLDGDPVDDEVKKSRDDEVTKHFVASVNDATRNFVARNLGGTELRFVAVTRASP